MNIKSILFNKEHLKHPFQIKHNNNEISIKEKKVKTIALSIIIGLFTFGIGGVLFFYCLTSKYKLKKLESIEHKEPSNPEKFNAKTEVQNQEFINNFVGSFLHPYITGQITRELDPEDRLPMIRQLEAKIPDFDKMSKTRQKEVEAMALNAFFEKAALGLYVNQIADTQTEFTSTSKEFPILIEALKESLPREFPDFKISDTQIKSKASKALKKVSSDRKEQLKKIDLEQTARKEVRNQRRDADTLDEIIRDWENFVAEIKLKKDLKSNIDQDKINS